MKIYEILKNENVGKIYTDDFIGETWILQEIIHPLRDEIELSLDILERGESIKDNFDLTMQNILEMEFEEE